MKYKILKLNEDGIIAFTQKELEELLEEIYQEGYEKGKSSSNIYYYPHWYWDTRPLNTTPTITWDNTLTGTTTIPASYIGLSCDYEAKIASDPLPNSFSDEEIEKAKKGAF